MLWPWKWEEALLQSWRKEGIWRPEANEREVAFRAGLWRSGEEWKWWVLECRKRKKQTCGSVVAQALLEKGLRESPAPVMWGLSLTDSYSSASFPSPFVFLPSPHLITPQWLPASPDLFMNQISGWLLHPHPIFVQKCKASIPTFLSAKTTPQLS